jgi:hypothetical protein
MENYAGNCNKMNDLSFKSLTASSQAPTQVGNIQDVWDWICSHAKDPTKPKECNPEGWMLQYLTKLQSHCGGAPFATILPGLDLLAEFDAAYPKVRKGVHPRSDLDQKIEAYKKWRRNARLAIEKATGATAKKHELRSREDGWTQLLDAIKLHSTDGCIYPAKGSPVTTLADIARRAGIEPWNLTDDAAMVRLEDAFDTPQDLQTVRKAQRFLTNYAILPEIAAVLPNKPVLIFPNRRERQALPAHIEDYLYAMVERAGSERDEVAGKDQMSVAQSTKSGWMSALRHHVRTLPLCQPEPEMGYPSPISHLESVNDVASLFNHQHLFAAIRHTGAVEHLHDKICHVSAYEYYSDIITVLFRNNPEMDEFGHVIGSGPELISDWTGRKIKNSKFMKEGRELAKGMTTEHEAWCKALVQSKMRRNQFRSLHRTMMGSANAILNAANEEDRELTFSEMEKVRQLGTCAAASAIEWAGRPIRMANALNLRLFGSRRNFYIPTNGHPTYSFKLFADETKSGKAEPETHLHAKLYGPQVLSWYLKNIRPLFPHHKTSTYLFPAIQREGQPLIKQTFDRWFQAAASAADLPMTFHLWRHGYASLLLSADWGNLPFAAQMLGNTDTVCARNYAWIDTEKLILDAQEKTIAAAEADQ